MAARANDISDLVILRTDRRTNGVGITKADAFSGTARNRLSIDLRIAASVAREVNIFTGSDRWYPADKSSCRRP